MSKFKIVNLIDKLFVSCAIFLIIYAWINFYLRDLWVTFILSLIFTAAILFLLFYFVNKKQQSKIISKKYEENMNTQFLVFRLNSKQKKLELLNNILSLEYSTNLKNNRLTYTKENKKHLVILATQFEIIDANILLNILDEFNDDEIDAFDIVCSSANLNINKNIFKNKEINFVTKKILFEDYFTKNNIFPDDSEINLEKYKFNFKNFLYALFTPPKAKGYFFCGLILIFSSIILPYHYYYIVVGSMLLLFSIICKLLPKFKD